MSWGEKRRMTKNEGWSNEFDTTAEPFGLWPMVVTLFEQASFR
jgi:hypothetical protein